MNNLRQIPILAALALVLASCTAAPTTPVCQAGAYLDDEGWCHPQRAPRHFLPFREGYVTRVMQGFHGYLSHKEDLSFSTDFRCTKGTPVTASRSGRVWSVKEDSDSGCADPSCIDQANYVILDHGDGTFSEYYHLMKHGALVEEGEQICAGQVLGVCGNTGYSSGPHLHFALTDASRRRTMPVRFVEMESQHDYGFPVPEAEYRSMNRLRSRCRDINHTRLNTDAFANQGIVLEESIPMVIDDGTRTFRVEGRYYGDHPNIVVHRKAVDGGPWLDECVQLDDDREFAVDVAWPVAQFTPGTYWMMLTGADEKCLSPGWAWSYPIRVR